MKRAVQWRLKLDPDGGRIVISRQLRTRLVFQVLRYWLLMAGIVLTAFGVRADTSKEYKIKAAFLFNFLQFVEWPSPAVKDADAPFCVGILGDDPFGAVLEETIRGEKVNNQSLSVQRSSRVDVLKNCQIIFISKSEKGRVSEILSKLNEYPIMTVSEVDGFARRGGVVNFYLEGGKVRFEINSAVAKRKGLKMSSQLLKLGKIVESAKEEK